MVSIIRPTGTTFYSLFNPNSWIGFNGLKYAYSVISAIDKRLPGNTKKWTLVLSWTARVRLVHPWVEYDADISLMTLIYRLYVT